MEGDRKVIPTVNLYTNFSRPEYSTVTNSVIDGVDIGVWDDSKWDGALWGSSENVYRKWKAVSGKGYSASLRVRTSTKKTRPSLISIEYIYTKGGVID